MTVLKMILASWYISGLKIMLDSDDYILPETVSLALKWLQEVETDPEYTGYINYLKKCNDRKLHC